MEVYKKAKEILRPIRKGNNTCYAITSKKFWLDNPKERSIKIFKIVIVDGNTRIGKRIAVHTFYKKELNKWKKLSK